MFYLNVLGLLVAYLGFMLWFNAHLRKKQREAPAEIDKDFEKFIEEVAAAMQVAAESNKGKTP